MFVGKWQFCSIIAFLCFITEEISGQGFNLVTQHLKLEEKNYNIYNIYKSK